MTKKDYIALAEAFNNVYRGIENNNIRTPSTVFVSIQGYVAGVLAEDKERFDPKKFWEACTDLEGDRV